MDAADQRWVVVAQVQSSLAAEEVADALEAKGLTTWIRRRQSGAVDALTSPASPFYEVCVLEEHAERARTIAESAQADFKAQELEAAAAAEEEELQSEQVAGAAQSQRG